MSKNNEDGGNQDATATVLSTWSRLAASAASVVLGAAGLTAVFVSSNQTGTALVIAVAALFGLLGLSGYLPSKLKLGDNEITMPIVNAVAKRIEKAPPEEAGELAASIISALPPTSQRHARMAAQGYLFEQPVMSAVAQVISEGAPYFTYTPDVDSSGASFYLKRISDKLSVGDDRHIGFVLKYFGKSEPPLPLTNKGTLRKFVELAERSFESRWALITNASISWQGKALIADAGDGDTKIDVISAGCRDDILEKLREILSKTVSYVVSLISRLKQVRAAPRVRNAQKLLALRS